MSFLGLQEIKPRLSVTDDDDDNDDGHVTAIIILTSFSIQVDISDYRN